MWGFTPKQEARDFSHVRVHGIECIGENIDLINEFYDFGVRHAGLTWNEENLLATGVRGTPGRGLTEAGRKAVRRIQDLGMLLDVSHLNDESFWGVMDAAGGPVVASHSNCRALCNHPRNLTDEQLKALAETGGVVGLNSFNEFVHREERSQTVENLVRHVVHMAELIGVDHIGFGFDFSEYLNGDTLSLYASQDTTCTIGLEDASCVPNLVKELKRAGFNQEEIEKITYKNWHRLMKEVMV
ncbi:dipeptidase [Hespellia stercorisuis]|uniref:Membrane dipeptidase n=1 Tax=Hespellia stercorisuis DSM 15480 TaxID=1121950 RepID=A0A1M6QVZ0_9FIRM|nr:membrane dipeptidase [Hespellia stercorisuis]SHK24310.1 membrane dipeptidase [Hespellia stercorisuis DSM 15480]